MHEAIIAAQKAGDSLGGIISCVCRNIPAGLGEPVFDKMEALLAQAMLSIPATKGIEIGSGFAGSRMRGSEHNDVFFKKGAQLGTKTNYSGGIQGGISNGEPIMFRVAFSRRQPSVCPKKPLISMARIRFYKLRGVMIPVWCRGPYPLSKVWLPWSWSTWR
jgi:chorismate synthase